MKTILAANLVPGDEVVKPFSTAVVKRVSHEDRTIDQDTPGSWFPGTLVEWEGGGYTSYKHGAYVDVKS